MYPLDYQLKKSEQWKGSLLEFEGRHLMCISQSDSCASPLPSIIFWWGRKNKSPFCQCKLNQVLRCAKSYAEMVLGISVLLLVWFFSGSVRVYRKLKPTSTTGVWRRAECTSLGPGLKHPSLRWLILVLQWRDGCRRFTWYCFHASIRAHHDDLHTAAAAVCVLSHET